MTQKKDFIRGMDVSSYLEMIDKGYKYYDYQGNQVDLLAFAKEQGFNYVRLRIWNNPSRIKESGGYCDLEKTIQMARLIKQQGYGFFLDFHYSDWWADPGHQQKPEAWENLSYDELKEAVYKYTKHVLTELKKENLTPDLVQIGNEIRTGMLFPDGAVNNWTGLAGLINSGIRGVREVLDRKDTQVVIHLDQGGHYDYFEEWFDAAMEHGVEDFDIIALSYYPFWHGTFFDFKNNLEGLAKRYGKKLLIAETAHAYQQSSDDFFTEDQERAAGFAATPENQRKVLELIQNIIGNVSGNMGMGFFYWEPFMRMEKNAGGWGNCMALVDEEGKAGEGLKAIAYDNFEADRNKIVKMYAPQEPIKVKPEGESLDEICPETLEAFRQEGILPAALDALQMDGNVRKISVEWTESDESTPEKIVLIGTSAECTECTKISVISQKDTEVEQNLLPNGNFRDDLKEWKIQIKSGAEWLRYEIESTEANNEKSLSFFSKSEYKIEAATKADVLEEGSYKLHCKYMGDNTTGVEGKLFARIQGVEYSSNIFPRDNVWQTYEIDEIKAPLEGSVEVGVWIKAPAGYGKIKDVCLVKNK